MRILKIIIREENNINMILLSYRFIYYTYSYLYLLWQATRCDSTKKKLPLNAIHFQKYPLYPI